MKEGIEVTLEQLLDARDQRAARQRMHISKLEVPLVCRAHTRKLLKAASFSGKAVML